MNNQSVNDPFEAGDIQDARGAEATKPAEYGCEFNEVTLAAIARELIKPVDAAEEKRLNDLKIARKAASAIWTELEQLALERARVWITHADGFGHGVSKKEAKNICSREAASIQSGVRAVVKRLASLIAAPSADDVLVSRAVGIEEKS